MHVMALYIVTALMLIQKFLVVDDNSCEDVEQADDDVEQSSDESEYEDEVAESLIKRSGKWSQLTQLVFKYSNLERVDESLVSIMSTVHCVKIILVGTCS